MTKRRPRPVIHARDHEHGGADPIRIQWEDVGDSGGGDGGGAAPLFEYFGSNSFNLLLGRYYMQWIANAYSGGVIAVDPADSTIIYMPNPDNQHMYQFELEFSPNPAATAMTWRLGMTLVTGSPGSWTNFATVRPGLVLSSHSIAVQGNYDPYEAPSSADYYRQMCWARWYSQYFNSDPYAGVKVYALQTGGFAASLKVTNVPLP